MSLASRLKKVAVYPVEILREVFPVLIYPGVVFHHADDATDFLVKFRSIGSAFESAQCFLNIDKDGIFFEPGA
jgi:hypothetical protein